KVNEVTAKLFQKYKTLDSYVKASRSRLSIKAFEKDIHSCGFFRNKTKNILAAAKLIKEKFCGTIPRTMKEMLTIPGVARKTANVVLGNAYGVVEGIAVDTHVMRLSQKFGLTDHKDPVKIERDLMELVPRGDWFFLTYGLIEYGRQICPARPHDCKKHVAL
ncbi:MAG: endonuclease III, partial [Parcubacteria group bacterium Greene1014_47]